MTYLYQVKEPGGRILYGIVEAADTKQVKRKFRDSEYYFVSCRPYKAKKFPKISCSLDTLFLFTQSMAILLEAGVPILMAFQILWRQSDDRTLQIVISHVKKRVEDGSNLLEAISEFPKMFPAMYLSLIGVAEFGAGLVPILKKLASYLEEQKRFITRLKRATLYPAVVFAFAACVLLGMFLFVIPTFQKVLTKLNIELPFATQMIINLSIFMRTIYFPILVLGLVGGTFFLYKRLKVIPAFTFLMDDWKIKSPIFGKIFYTLIMGRFIRSLSLLIGAGVPIIESFETAKNTVGNRRIERAVDGIKAEIMEGTSLYISFKNSKTFPLILVEMIGIGESSGNLGKMLEKMAVHFDEEADYYMNKFLTLLEPLLIIFVGAIVLLVLLGIYLPIFSLWQGLAR